MSRTIDRMPAPKEVRRKKIVVLSLSRSGTLGLYRALQILGYTPYHAYECFLVHGTEHTKVFKEAVIAHFNRLSGVKELSREDCDKWFADYDAIVEMTSVLSEEALESYVQDPDVKFILTERDPVKWARSINNTGAKAFEAFGEFPLNFLKYFDTQLYHFAEAHRVVYTAWASGTRPGEPDNEAMLCKYYKEYIQKVKAVVPADRRCDIQLDRDGLDWEDICTYLELPIPNEDYPDRNQPAKFQSLFEGFMKPRLAAAGMNCGAVVVPILAGLGWASMRYGPSLLAKFSRSA